jgi:hypothetical protein
MRHPTDGTLRRLVDEPVGVADVDREHVANCPECLAGLVTVQEDAALTRAALDVPLDTDVDRAWQRLSHATAEGARDRNRATTRHDRRWKSRLRSPVIAGASVLALLAGASAAAAGDWLQIFRTERVAPVTVTEQDLVEIPDLAAYGDVKVVEEPHVRGVASAAAAEKATGLEAPQVADLPRGVTGTPSFEVAAIWSEGRGLPALVVARAVAPTAYSSGVPFDTARDYLLSLPGLPENLASQLRSFSADGATLPVPVNDDLMTSSSTDVDGADATLLEARNGTMAGVVWVQDGVVTVVAGSVTDDEVLAVARGLE